LDAPSYNAATVARWSNMWGAKGPPVPADEARRRRREVAMIAATAVVFLIFAILETRLASFSNSSSLSGNVTFFLLINLNLILLVLLIFLVTRNLVKLFLERRRGMFGSRLRTRLVLAFVGLTLAPSLLLFLVAQGFLNVAFDSWFNVRVDNSLRGSLEVSQSYYQFAANNALHLAREIGRQSAAQGLWTAKRRVELQRFIDNKLNELALGGVEVFGANRTSLARSHTPDVSALPAQPLDAVADLVGGNEMTRTQRFGRGDLVRAGVPVRGDDGVLLGGVVVDYIVPRNVSEETRAIARSYKEYRQLSGIKQPIKNVYVLSLSLITLVVVFSATWFGIRQAKSITTPLQRLAEGTREVAQGNWTYRIEEVADQETAELVDSFNQMTADLQQINSELVERRKYVESLLANIAAGVVSLNESGAVTMLNPGAERMLGLTLVQVRGRPWREVFARPDLQKVADVVGEIVAHPDHEVERQIKLTGGEHIVTALVNATSLTDELGAPRGAMLFFEDVTHLLRVQRMEAWREVARRLAHEIKNPLTPIQLSAQRLQKRYGDQLPDGERVVFDECTTTIVRQVEELKRLVNEFSTFARLPAVELLPSDLNEIVDEALVLFRAGHPDIDFVFTRGDDLPPLELDREAIKRALINLFDNAVSACRGIDERPRIEVATTHAKARAAVRLEIADNGVGMSRDVKLRLFEPYFSTKKDGTGLGLAIVASIVSDHQAYVRVLDNPPRGTRFVIDFPLRQRSQSLRVAARA
jgi:two-component system nitrogen regulation sensor histidine kinase NtrY